MKPLKLVVTEQVEALRNLPVDALKTTKQDERQDTAIKCTALLLGRFRKCDADDPEIYSRTIESVLGDYDPDIQKQVTNPGRWKYPPSDFEIREACESIANARARAKEREDNLRKQLEERRRLDALETERKALASPPRNTTTAHLTIDEQERREAERMLARYKAEAEASARPPAQSVFELDPADWNA
jgi:hypothetical protein